MHSAKHSERRRPLLRSRQFRQRRRGPLAFGDVVRAVFLAIVAAVILVSLVAWIYHVRQDQRQLQEEIESLRR